MTRKDVPAEIPAPKFLQLSPDEPERFPDAEEISEADDDELADEDDDEETDEDDTDLDDE